MPFFENGRWEGEPDAAAYGLTPLDVLLPLSGRAVCCYYYCCCCLLLLLSLVLVVFFRLMMMRIIIIIIMIMIMMRDVCGRWKRCSEWRTGFQGARCGRRPFVRRRWIGGVRFGGGSWTSLQTRARP